MGGKITAALSAETRELLKQNQFFYDSVTKLFDQTQLSIKGRDEEAKTEVELLSDGNLAVHVLLPLDGNDEASDGRIYLRDTFVFDSKQKELHSHKRSFEYNGRGENKAEWQKWLEQYKASGAPVGAGLQAFAASVARSYGRPFQEKHSEVFKANREFYGSLLGSAVEQGLTLKLRDPRSSYVILHRGLVNEIVFNITLTDNEGRPGHLTVKESFQLDGNTRALVGYKRHVEVAPESTDAKFWQQKADALNATVAPDVNTARAFIANFVPDILTDLPEFSSTLDAPPAGSYPEMTQADFHRTMGAISRSRNSTPMAKLDPEFFKTLDAAQAYLQPLKDSMGEAFELNLKDPPLRTSVQVLNGKTQVFVTYSLKPKNGESGVLEYGERWTFEHGQLTAVDRQAKALNAPAGGEVEAASLRVKDAIQNGKFGDAKDEGTFRAIAAQAGYLAPHLSYVGIPDLLQQNPEQASPALQMILPLMQKFQSDLVPVLYQNEVDPEFREDLLRMNDAMIHGDQETMARSLTRLQAREQKAVSEAKSPEEKQRHQENLQISNLILTLSSGDMEKAQQISKLLVSPAYKKIFAEPLGQFSQIGQLTEGMTLIGKLVQEEFEVGQKQGKGWFADAPKYTGEDKDALESLSFKVLAHRMMATGKKKSSADSMAAIQTALDYGKDKKPEEMKEEEKKLLLTASERAVAEKIKKDPLAQKLADIAMEEDKDMQAKEYFELARSDLFEKSLFQTSRFLAQSVVPQKMPKTGTSESLEILRVFALEKSEIEQGAKLKALPPPPQEIQSLGPLLQKINEKAAEDPSKPILNLLSELSNLSEDEKKLVTRLQNSPSMKKISETSGVATIAGRFQVYQQVISPFMTDQGLMDDVIAELEKDPKQSIKQVFGKIQGLAPAQQQLLAILEEKGLFPQIDQKLAVAVTMPATEKSAYYRQNLAEFFPDLLAAQEVDKALAPFSKVEDTAQVQAFEGAALAAIVLSGEMTAEHRPQTQQAKAFARVMNAEHEAIHSLLGKAEALVPMHPNASALAMLRELKDSDLNPAEQEIRKKLLADTTIVPILEIGAEADMVKRHEAYLAHTPDMEKGEPSTLGKAGFSQTELYLTQALHTGKIPDVASFIEMPELKMGQQPERKHFAAAGAQEHQAKLSRDLRKFLAMLEGKGDFGSKVGYGLPHFSKELTKPTSLAAMMAAPLVGGATQLAFFHRLKTLGTIGKGVSVMAGVGAEAATFTYLHAKGEKYAYGNDTPEKHFWNDLKTNVMLFGAMRGAHLGTNAIGQKVIATGKLGKWGGGYVAGERAATLNVLPTKQLTYLPSGGGIGVPQLTVGGERVVSLLHHGGALAGMHFSSQLSHKLGWQEQAPGFDDTLMMYMQAIAGYSLANSASGGRLSRGMADLNMRMENVSGGQSAEGIQGQIGKLQAEKARLEGEKSSLNDAARREVDTQVNKIEGQVLKLQKRLDGLKPADKKSTDSTQADLVQLFEIKPEEVVLSEAQSGAKLKATHLKAGEELSLDAQLLGREGSEIVLRREADGTLKLHDLQKADAPEGANGEPAPLPAIVLLNGKALEKSTVLAEGDVVSVAGKEVRVGVERGSPLHSAMAHVPRAQQLSLSKQIAKAKKISELFKILRDSPHGGAGEVMVVTAEVLSGRRSLESLPHELGIQTKVKSLLEAQVQEWKKSGFATEGYELKEGALPSDVSQTEVQYHTLRAVSMLKAGVEGSRTIYDLLQAIGQSSLKTVEGVSTQRIFDSLGLESQKGLLEKATKAEAELREKIRLAERAIKREKKAWAKTDKEVVEIQEKTRNELTEKADGLKELIEMLEKEVSDRSGDRAQAGRELGEIIQDLPLDLGIRQKALDAAEQSQGDFVKTLTEKEQGEVVEIAKRYLGASEIDFSQAQSLLRSIWDGGNWQGNLLLRRLKPSQLELAMKVYYGSRNSRNIAPDQALRLVDALSRSSLKENFGIVLSQAEGSGRLELVRSEGGEFNSALVKQGDVVILSTHALQKGEGLSLSSKELTSMVEQAKKDWQETGGSARTAKQSPLQLSDSQLYFDAETRSYQTWTLDSRGLSKIRVTLSESGEVESIQVKYAMRPGQSKLGEIKIPKEFAGEAGKAIEVTKQEVDFQALAKELPFELKGPSLAFRALSGMTRARDRIPSLPKWPQGGAKKADAAPKPETKTESEAPVKKKKKKAATPSTDAATGKPKSEPRTPFWRGPAAWLSGKLPKFSAAQPAPKSKAKTEVKKAEPAPPSVDPSAKGELVPPPVTPPKAEGNRPTLPQDLKFPPAQVGMGERGEAFANLEIAQSANGLMGEYAGKTHEGVGRKRNEDGIGMAYTNERDLVLLAVDGMGGHHGGKEAAQITLESATEALQTRGDLSEALLSAHDKVVRDLHPGAPKNRAPGAGVGAVKIRRPDSPDGPYSMEASWGGDVSILVLRRGSDGQRHWVYRNAEDNVARQAVDMGIEAGHLSKEGRDLQVISHFAANMVNNVIGATSSFTPRRTQEGFVSGPEGTLKQANGLDRIALEKNDVVMILPDGTSKNLRDLQVLIDLISGQESASDITRTVDTWVGDRMKTAERIEKIFEADSVPANSRQPLTIDGVQRFVDARGNVYENLTSDKLLDHYETDNFSAMVYVHNPETGSRPKKDSDPGFGQPSDNSLSDPDQTQIFKRPGSSDDK